VILLAGADIACAPRIATKVHDVFRVRYFKYKVPMTMEVVCQTELLQGEVPVATFCGDCTESANFI